MSEQLFLTKHLLKILARQLKVCARLPDKATAAAFETNKAAIHFYMPGHPDGSLELEPPRPAD